MKRRGRPPIPTEEKRRCRSVWMTDAEWAVMKARAADEGVGISELLRRLLDAGP